MSWLYSQALVEEYSVANYSDGEQSAPLSGNHIQQAYCAPDKMTVFSRLSRYGMTYKPLTESRGEELLTLYREVFHAKTLAQQEREQESMANEAECGEKWHASFAKYDQDTYSWKTHQCSLLGDSEEFSETWPQWGLMRDGECWEQRTLEQTIRGTGYGLSEKWATPTTMDKLPPKSQQALLKEATFARPGRSKPANLRDQVSNMQNWPTPTAHMAKETNAPSEHKRNTTTLTAQVNLPTPQASDWKNKDYSRDTTLGKMILVTGKTHAEETGGKLNPMWVEWLMGWPLGWTDLKPLEMDKSHCAPQQLGESSQKESK